MSEPPLIKAVQEEDLAKVEALLDEGKEVNEQGEQGWTPLNWAAGKGNVDLVRLLLDRGADVTRTGRDNRTPLMIAKAAGRDEVAALLTAREQELGVWQDPRSTRPYCRAYYLPDLEAFSDWPVEATDRARIGVSEGNGDSSDTETPVVFVHQDFSVTQSMWHGEDVVFEGSDPAWRKFCEEVLEFSIPEDLL